jgi:hypothetical protein
MTLNRRLLSDPVVGVTAKEWQHLVDTGLAAHPSGLAQMRSLEPATAAEGGRGIARIFDEFDKRNGEQIDCVTSYVVI